jgi:four helix bundle protein
MTETEFRRRTKKLALMVIPLVDELPNTRSGRAIGNQLIRSETGVGSNYRAACCAKSKIDMAAKMRTVIEEADETMYWLELLVESKTVSKERAKGIHQEAKALFLMSTASRKTLRGD